MSERIEALHPYVQRVLLQGWHDAPLPRGVRTHGELAPWAREQVTRLWFGGPPLAGQLWQAHETALRKFAARHGLRGTIGSGRLFYGEAAASMGPKHR